MATFETDGDPITDPTDETTGSDLTGWLPTAAPEPPDVTVEPGRIRKLGVLSEGFEETVYRATDPGDGTVFAVRTFAALDSLDGREDVVGAITAWKRISGHSHVHSLLDWGTNPRLWLALEHVGGGTLRDRIDDLTGGGMIWTAMAILRALSYAHSRGVCHHGLTPETVWFFETVDADWGFPVVTDWGVARAVQSEPRDRVDRRYAAPEQLDPDTYGRPDQATDVYRAGAVLYELFTGQPPYTYVSPGGASTQDVWPAPPGEVDSTLPRGINRILFRSLSKERTVRYETIHDFRRAMERFVGDYAGSAVLDIVRSMERDGTAATFDYGLSPRERAVFRAVAAADEPLSAWEVVARLADEEFSGLQYAPRVVGVLNGLVDEGLVSRIESETVYYTVCEDADYHGPG